MNRRELLALVGGAAAIGRSSLAAAQGRKVARVGFISGLDQAAAADFLSALRNGLAAFGYVEPLTLKMELLFAEYVPARIPQLVDELEWQHVDVIVTHAGATGSVVKGNRTIPAVCEFSADPVSLGIATDLSHPLLNATGIGRPCAATHDTSHRISQQPITQGIRTPCRCVPRRTEGLRLHRRPECERHISVGER